MADIRLAKPAAGTTQTVPSAPDGRFIFDFPADAATLTRNGDDLVLTFEDGAAIQLQGFYTTYSKEEMPSFQVDGVEISGQDFFAALDEDLMPAAGPASGSSAARGGRYNEYGGSDLLDGLDHLGRLDIGFDGGTQLATDTVEPSPYSEVDHGVTVTPSGVGAATEVVTVYEAGLEGGSQAGEKDAPTMAGGSLSINAPDGVASIVIGGVVVFENGALTGKVVSTDEGTLSVTGYDPATGKLDFSYSLDRNTTEHVKSDPDTDTQISHTLVVTVTDTDGDSGSTTITVNVVDDMPEARADSISFTEAEAQKGASGESVLENDVFGADAPAYKTVTSIEGGTLGQPVQGDYGTLTLNEDGTYTYKLGDKVDVPRGETYMEQFTYTIKDADGDTSTATLTIAIKGDEIVPANPGSATIVVDEALLTDGNVVNSDNFDHKPSGTGSFIVNLNGEDGTVTLKYGSGPDAPNITVSLINGDTFDENWLSTNKTLTVNGVEVTVTGATQQDDGSWKIEYSYSLTGQQTHTGQGVGENDALSGIIGITVTDATGDTSTGSLTVTVHDDGPVASGDVNSLAETSVSVSGNVLDNDESGADGWRTDADGNITAVELSGSAEGTYGELTLNADGSYTYTRNETGVPDGGASDTFTYIAYDADGDAVEKTLTITIENTDPTAPGGEGHTLTVTLSDAKTAGGNSDTVSQSVDLFDGPEAFTSAVFGSTAGIVVSGGESFTWSLSDGKLIGIGAESDAVVTLEITGITPDGTVTVIATLENPAHHNDGSNSLDISGIVITATDAGGSTVSGTMNVVVTDDGVDVENFAGSSLTVDESYADNVAGPGLELEESANTDTVSLDVSNLFSVDAGADGEAGREFALSISNNGQTGQKVLVGGSQYDLILRENNDGSISGVAGDENGTVIFNITISNGGNVTLDMTGYGSLVHPYGGSTAQEHDEALSITGVEVTLTVTDTDGDSDSASADLVLTFEDDGPGLTVTTDEVPDAPDTPVRNLGSGEAFSFVPDTPEKPDASDYKGGEEDPKYLAALHEYNTEITAAKQEAEGMAGQLVESDILSQNGWEGVSIYAGKVTYNTDGTVQELDTPENYKLQYSNYASNSFTVDNKPAADWGIMVASPDDDNESWADDNYETNVIDGNASEAIVIDLGGQLAYGIELSFGAFYSNYHGTEGAEKLLITFYKGSELVESRFVDSVDIGSSNTGKVTYSTDLIAGGFDKVVVSAVLGEHGRESSFTLQGVDFVTAPLAIAVASGELDVASGADGYAEDFAVANVQFAMEQMFTLQADGTYSLSILDGNNASKSAIVTVIIDDLGNSRLTATVDGNELFSATLEKDGDGWSWKMEQYQEFLVQGKDGQLGDLELGFITMDGDDDTATETVNIPLKNLPDLAVSQTTLVTDESYIDGLGSNTGPAEVGDGQANSAKASGTMSVNTYGKEGELILTIDGKVFVFQLDADGKLSGTSEALVTTTYGTLTLTNGEAGKITYIYTQTQPYSHTLGEGPDQSREAESFTVQVKADGEMSDPATITVSIEDDAPVVTVEEGVSAQLEVTETGTAFMEASTLFDVNYGADGKKENTSPKYELTYDTSKNPGLTAIVGGQEEEVTLQLEGGILKGTAGETTIFTISVDESTGKVTLKMTGNGSLKHEGSNGQELHLKGVGVKVTVTDGDDDSTTSDSADLTLTITDDVPTISESQKAVIISPSEEDEDIADFDFNNATKDKDAQWVPTWVEEQLPPEGNGQVWDHDHERWGREESGYKKLGLTQDSHKITFSAAVVQYQGSDGNPIEHGDQDAAASSSIHITDITNTIVDDEAPLLTFVSTAWNKGESGMAVYSGLRDPKADQSDGEIGAINGQFKDDNTAWEAVKMDLGVDNAYSITITLNSFYNTQGDQEKAYIILMDGDKVVDKLLIEGQDAENGIVDSTKLSSAEAFNTVYIVPWGTKSDFLLNGVEVGYSPVTVLKSEGQVKAVSADDIKGYSFGYDQNDVVTVNEKNLTVSVEDDGKTIHFLSSSSDDDTYTKVIVGEATITEAGKWTLNWFDQETNPQQDTDFTLPIIATDGDDDTAEIKVVPSEDEVGDSQAADALPEEEEKQPAAEKREGKDGPQGMMDGALLQSSMAAEAAAPRMAAATLLGMALVADAADDVLAAATGTDGMPHADVKADGLSGDIGDAPSTLHMDGAAQSGADAFDATLDSSLFAPGVMDPLADGTESLEGLLPDKEHAPFDAEGLLFTAAAPDLSDDASGLVGKGVASGDVLPPAGEEGILGTEETDVLHGTDADDILRGGDGDELIFGGSGDDYIDGGEGRDTIYAGDGNDIIVYDKADYLVSGGSGIDFMVSDDSNLTLETLLKGGTDDNEGPIVNSIEVLLKGNDALSLTSLDQLARDYGITLDSKDGKEVLQLDGRWEKQDDGSYDFNGGAEEGGLTLETNLQHDSDASSDNGEMAQQVFILEHTNS